MTIVELINYVSAGFALLAAFFWFSSAVFKPTLTEDEPDDSGFSPARIIIDGADLPDILREQSKRNAAAALCAGVVAVLQTIVLV